MEQGHPGCLHRNRTTQRGGLGRLLDQSGTNWRLPLSNRKRPAARGRLDHAGRRRSRSARDLERAPKKGVMATPGSPSSAKTLRIRVRKTDKLLYDVKPCVHAAEGLNTGC